MNGRWSPNLWIFAVLAIGLLASDVAAANNEPPKIVDVRVGFAGKFKVGRWAPVAVDVAGAAEDVHGRLRITALDGDGVVGRAFTLDPGPEAGEHFLGVERQVHEHDQGASSRVDGIPPSGCGSAACWRTGGVETIEKSPMGDGDEMRHRKADGTVAVPRDFHRVGPPVASTLSSVPNPARDRACDERCPLVKGYEISGAERSGKDRTLLVNS